MSTCSQDGFPCPQKREECCMQDICKGKPLELNYVIPFDAKVFFKGGWEFLNSDGIPQGDNRIAIDLDTGKPCYYVNPQMRKKKVKMVRWLNLYFTGEVSVHSSKESADGFRTVGRRFECRKIEWEV